MHAGAFQVVPGAIEEGPRAVSEMKNVATGCSDIFTLAGSKTARFRGKMGVLYICKKVPCLTKVPTRLPATTKSDPPACRPKALQRALGHHRSPPAASIKLPVTLSPIALAVSNWVALYVPVQS